MQPQNFHFGGGASATFLHPVVAVGMLIALALIFTLKRREVIAPFVLAYFSIPAEQVLVLGGVHFTMRQILILAVLVRMIAFPGTPSVGRFAGGFNRLDWVVVLWASAAFVIFNLEWMAAQALIKSLGDLIEALGGYLAARFLITDREDVRRAVKLLAVVCMIQGVCMMSEQFTRQNVFAFAGAHPPTFRNGHVRAEGAMGNLWTGAIAGSLIPMFLWLWTERKSRTAAYTGLAGAGAMIVASFASTSWMTLGGSLMALAFWPIRKSMRMVRWGIVAALVGLQCVMKGPVWSLIEKVDLTGGSSSYHRYMLVDNAIRHFGEWWLLGYRYYGSWGWDMYDLCNQYVVAALTGGLVTLVLYIMIYTRGFGEIGRARRRMEGDRHEEWFFWCLAACLFSCVVNSFGINYLYHLLMCFLLLLACISVATSQAAEAPAVSVLKPAEEQFALATAGLGTCASPSELSWESWGEVLDA
jgi:hypothetical protein